MSNPLTPLVDFSRTFVLEQYDPTLAAYTPVITGPVTCYLAAASDAVTAADPSLTGTATYIGGVGTPAAPAGTWFFGLDASVLTFALLDSLYNNTTTKPWFVVLKPSGVRAVEPLKYTRVKTAVIA